MMMADNPCKRDCERRKIGCHGKCADYAAFRKGREKESETRVIQASINQFCVDNACKTARRTRKEI